MGSSYLDKWLLYSRSIGNANSHDGLIHPDDLLKAAQKEPGILECIGEEGEYLILKRLDGVTIRAKAAGIHCVLPSPRFRMGDRVQEIARPGVQGLISGMLWHYKDAACKFFIMVDGKKKSRRYRAEELAVLP
ncbi:hypothetical protein [Taibaiella koreensis]|uniref:hypothetical protein n=1 Tax=Taibaiella koreensis TaxID=1268548 RepID=UPI000E59B6DC|nr:hypothetical protein [Taibaiella koreensis]